MAQSSFSPGILRALQNILQLIPARANNPHALYDCWRATMGKICPIDAFFVGYFYKDQTIAFPYTFDGEVYDSPDRHIYADNGVAAWVLIWIYVRWANRHYDVAVEALRRRQ